MHKPLSSDRCAPDHIPEPGRFVCADIPEGLKRPVALGRIEGARDDLPLGGEEIPEAVERVMEGFEDRILWLFGRVVRYAVAHKMFVSIPEMSFA